MGSTTTTMELHQVMGSNLVERKDEERQWFIDTKKGRGRCLIATTPIQVGDVILEEMPAVWGPKQLSPTSCLGCYMPLEFEEVTFCDDCGLPLCSTNCANLDNHRAECEMLHPARSYLLLNSEKDLQQAYYFITTVRTLWMRKNNKEQWEAVSKLMSNLEERRGSKIFQFNQTYVVETLKHFGVQDFSDDEIQKVCGIFDSNAFESCSPSRVPCRGLYVMASMINSSCLPNTRHYFKNSGELVVVASRPIAKGEEILVCYTQPRWSTSPRQKHLSVTKLFRCECARCTDPEEQKMFSSSLLCPNQGCRGAVCPLSMSSARTAGWNCRKCGTVINIKKVTTCQTVCTQMVHTRERRSSQHLLNLINKLSTWLYPTHYTLTELKMAAITEWGDPDFVPFEDMSQTEFETKIAFCFEMLDIVEDIEGESCRTKAFIIYSS